MSCQITSDAKANAAETAGYQPDAAAWQRLSLYVIRTPRLYALHLTTVSEIADFYVSWRLRHFAKRKIRDFLTWHNAAYQTQDYRKAADLYQETLPPTPTF